MKPLKRAEKRSRSKIEPRWKSVNNFRLRYFPKFPKTEKKRDAEKTAEKEERREKKMEREIEGEERK